MHAVRSTQRPSGSISRLSSAIGMNSPGSSRPRVGCSQRTSASTPASRWLRELEDRLVVQGELGVSQRLRQRLLELHPLDHRRVHLGLVHLLLPLALGLRAVEREVGVAKQVVGARRRRSRSRCWRRRTPRGPGSRTARSSPRGCGCATRATRGSSTSSSRTTNSSPPKRAAVSAARMQRLQPVRRLAQQLVARGVAEGVVDVLERVEVDEQHGGPRSGARGARERMLEAVDRAAAGSGAR